MPQDLADHQDEERDREEAEGVRLAYVAATRARDLLVVPAVGDCPYAEGWINPLNQAIYPALAVRRTADAPPGLGGVTFGLDSVVERPENDPARSDTVSPGLHQIGDGRAVPRSSGGIRRVCLLACEQRFGLRRDDLIARDVPADVVEEKLRGYRDWQQWRDSALEAGAQPSVQVKTAGEWARSGQWLPGIDELPPVDELSVARDLPTPSGRRFGSLVHAVLANAVLGDGGESVEALAQVQARLLGAPAEEAAAAAGIARGVLTHPILREAARAAERGACRREMPVTFSCPDGTVIEGGRGPRVRR